MIVEACDQSALATARALFHEYAESLKIDLCFQNFATELATLPGAYARPGGRLLLASVEQQFAGCVALRPLGPGVAEMKRLYVRPSFRGFGVGRILAEAIVKESRLAGYRRLRLDTLPSMGMAQSLYRHMGFRPIAPYPDNPVEGAVYLELELASP
jgi:ribosomal protein S18 acetylase RimI-like enzyme